MVPTMEMQLLHEGSGSGSGGDNNSLSSTYGVCEFGIPRCTDFLLNSIRENPIDVNAWRSPQ